VTSDDSVIVRAEVTGRPDLYEAPVLAVSDPTAVTVRDSITGATVSGSGAMRLHATNGVARDSLRLPTLVGSWATAWKTPGTWTVSIDAEGYHPWRQDGLVVTKGLCHMRPVAVTARLQRP
ncbi:MAG: hypothetical protein C0497_14060, partial [Gemmatimonas sp.]|nr:hypothetical protein [Gemmatimonas sp.]